MTDQNKELSPEALAHEARMVRTMTRDELRSMMQWAAFVGAIGASIIMGSCGALLVTVMR